MSEINKTTNTNTDPNQKKDSTMKKVIGIIAVAVAVIVILLLMRGCDGRGTPAPEESVKPKAAIGLDINAEEGDLTQRSPEEIKAELNQKVQEGMIRISMNTAPTFADGTAEGNLLIVNKETNNYPQVVYIYVEDDDEIGVYNEFAGRNVIYCSGAIPVGSKVEYAKLDVDLEPGEYNCIAALHNYDLENGRSLGEADAKIVVKVLG